ncbi:MAG: flavin reductase [Calditrichaeota bacterium]|nr:MAG: flavin reductase [Calditrichota bacterium]
MKDISKVLKRLEYGVYVVTMGKGTEGNAFTASWVMQVSSEPPMIAIAVHNKHQSARLISQANGFAVNLIGKGQDEVVKAYYGPAESGYNKLEGTSVKDSPITKTPLIPGAIGYFDCELKETVKAGNHSVFIGEIKAAELDDDVTELLTTSNSKMHYLG